MIKFYPDPILRDTCLKVPKKDAEAFKSTAEAMKQLCQTMNGAGLSGNQFGIKDRVAVIVPEEGDSFFIINPEILESSDPEEMDEGCLSLPGVSAKITRFAKIKVKYMDLSGKYVTKNFEGKTAQIVQHEIEHLDGKYYLDHLGPMNQALLFKKAKKFLSKLANPYGKVGKSKKRKNYVR